MKTTLLFCALLFSVLSTAQTTVFQSDFSNPASYQVANSGGGDWIITNSGPTGSTAQFMGPLNSSTPNEFALYDSQAFGGQQYGQIQMTDYIDISGFTFAYVCFQSYYKHDAGTCNLQVSIDGGVSWVNYSVHASLPQGDSTANPEMELIDVSAQAGNQPVVLIRFVYDGPAGYAWMIDDVCVLANNSPILGLDDVNEDESFKIYPNPSNGNFTVDLHAFQGNIEVRVSDLQGRILRSEMASPSMHSIDLELDEAPGTYIVTVVHDKGQSTSTVVKK